MSKKKSGPKVSTVNLDEKSIDESVEKDIILHDRNMFKFDTRLKTPIDKIEQPENFQEAFNLAWKIGMECIKKENENNKTE